MSLLSPTIFMTRRLAYAYILVNWVNESIILVLGAVLLQTGLQLAYQAHCRPNWSSNSNKIELFNEISIFLGVYCLGTFTDFVSDPKTRYICGWALIFLVLCNLVAFNLVYVIKQSYLAWKNKMRLRAIKNRNRRLME